MKNILLTGAALLAAAGLALATPQAQDPAPAKPDPAAVVKAQRPSYPLRACVVSGKKFSREARPVEHVVNGRLVLLCSDECAKKVDASPETYLAKVNEAVIAEQKPGYPMTTCVVSAEALGEMGAPIEMVHGTRLVRLCCKGCRKAFLKEPDKFLAQIDEKLIEKQRADYPVKACLVSGEELGSMGEPVDRLYGTTLVRLCCKGCVRAFDKDPEALVAKVLEARKAARKEG